VDSSLAVEWVSVAALKPHPRNYRTHPEDQLEHIIKSIETHGFYRNIVVARDNTILAGHGVTEAAKKMGRAQVPVIRLDVGPDDPSALKVIAGDNEIGRLGEVDDRALTDLLKEIASSGDAALLGTGFDEQQLAALVFTTRPFSELATLDEASEWVGMPSYEEGGTNFKLVMNFKTAEDREEFLKKYKIRVDKNAVKGNTTSTRWPWTDRENRANVRFEPV
jgi:ParB-like nuclease family protein